MTILNIGYTQFGRRKMKKRRYKSLVRQRQAGDTRRRIVDAARQLLQSAGYDGQERMIISLRDAGRLRKGLNYATARAIFWMLTGRDVYRMLVRERRWPPQKYQDWLADTLVDCLLTPPRPSAVRSRVRKERDSSLRLV